VGTHRNGAAPGKGVMAASVAVFDGDDDAPVYSNDGSDLL
jgi:hypothetical protein